MNGETGKLAAATAIALAALASGAAGAASQMYKCVDGGRTVYQQQACAVKATEPAESATSPAGKASAAADAASTSRKLRRPSPAASSSPATPR